MAQSASKRERHTAILELIRARRVYSQDELRPLLRERGFHLTQTTLSRDLRELRVAKVLHGQREYRRGRRMVREGSASLRARRPCTRGSLAGGPHWLYLIGDVDA